MIVTYTDELKQAVASAYVAGENCKWYLQDLDAETQYDYYGRERVMWRQAADAYSRYVSMSQDYLSDAIDIIASQHPDAHITDVAIRARDLIRGNGKQWMEDLRLTRYLSDWRVHRPDLYDHWVPRPDLYN